MNGEMRRAEILKILTNADKVISASVLAATFGVSRQVIVQDIALLRANGVSITSLARGYVLDKSSAVERVFKVSHTDEDVGNELNLIVDLGGVIKDVFVYHKIYGIVKAALNIKSRIDVNDFLAAIKSGKSSLLKNITSGYHYHTVTADKEETLELIERELSSAGFLAPLQQFEPFEISNKG